MQSHFVFLVCELEYTKPTKVSAIVYHLIIILVTSMIQHQPTNIKRG